MTPQEFDRVRRAITALRLHRSGAKPLSEEHEGIALNIVEAVAAETKLPIDDILAGYDPDPRVGSLESKDRINDVLLDLDELERARCIMLVKRLETLYRSTSNYDPAGLPTLWMVAHDQAIVEVTHARALNTLNGSMQWSNVAWGGGRKDASRRP